ncbi:MAG: O-antigen ligase family protein, partial [Actinobacteria bacterium]|nr:O-antigen ligase family protein [Actinomycetota bacterium]
IPLITSRFYNLKVNSYGHNATGAIIWTLRYLFYYIAGFGLIFIVFNVIKSKRDFFISFAVLIASSFPVILVGLYQKYFNAGFGNVSFWVNAGRVNSTFTDPNALGSYIILLFPLFIAAAIFFKKWYFKILTLAYLLVFVYLAFLSGSRNAFLSILLSLSIFAIIGVSIFLRYFLKKKIKKPNSSAYLSAGIVVLIIIILISAFIGLLLGTDVFKPMTESRETGIMLVDRVYKTVGVYYKTLKTEGFYKAIEAISSGREILWQQALFMFRDHPVSGVGQGAYFIELSDYHLKYHRGFHLIDFAGNYYLQILSELGFVGTVLVLFIFFLFIKKAFGYFLVRNSRSALKREDWLLAGIVISFAVMAAVFMLGPHTNFIEVQFLFCLVLGLIIAYINASSRESLNHDFRNEISEMKTVKVQEAKTDWKVPLKPGSFKEKISSISGQRYLNTASLKQMRFDLASLIALVFILVSFTAALTYSSVTDLSINYKQAQYSYENDYGFYGEEFEEGKSFRWTAKDASVVLSRTKSNRLIIPMKIVSPVDYRIPNFIRIYIDNTLVKIIKAKDDKWHDIEIDLKNFPKKRITVTISMNHSWVPKEYGISSDTRELGVKVGTLRYEE